MKNKEENLKEVLKYLFENKNGLEKDFIEKFDKDMFLYMAYMNFLKPCVRVNGEKSWIVTNDLYDFYTTITPKNKEKNNIIDKIIDFLNYILYFREEIKKNNLKEKEKKEYFSFKNKNTNNSY